MNLKIDMDRPKISYVQYVLTVINVLALTLANILVVKSFQWGFIATSAGILTFPLTYILSDVFSEVYGYKWSRITARWAFIGTGLASILFTLMIKIPSSVCDATTQSALETVFGSSLQITIGSIMAFYIGDFANDVVFKWLKKVLPADKFFGVRAVGSSLVGKVTDQVIMCFVGLSFLPMSVKLNLIATTWFVQVAIELVMLPLTHFVVRKVKAYEEKQTPVCA